LSLRHLADLDHYGFSILSRSARLIIKAVAGLKRVIPQSHL